MNDPTVAERYASKICRISLLCCLEDSYCDLAMESFLPNIISQRGIDLSFRSSVEGTLFVLQIAIHCFDFSS